MLHDMQRGLKPGALETLNGSLDQKIILGHSPKDGSGFSNGTFQLGQGFCFGDTPASREFTRPFAPVWSSSYARDNPLANVSAQVKQQISDAVFGFGAAPPGIVFVQEINAFLDLGQKIQLKMIRRLSQERLRDLSVVLFHAEPPGEVIEG
jgi:hypothetical protein